MSEPLTADYEIANVELLVQQVRNCCLPGLYHIDKVDHDTLMALNRLLIYVDRLVAHARYLDEQLRQALVNSRDYGG